MDRRTLLVGLSTAAAWLSLSACAGAGLNGRAPASGTLAAPLSEQLAGLADPLFREYSAGRSLDGLITALAQKGVISTRQGINHEKLLQLAREEPLMIYKGFYYTRSELDLYALAYLHSDRSLSSIPQ